MRRLIAASFIFLPLTAHAFTLSWPLECELGRTCFIQNLADHDASSGMKDFACNRTTYDKHDGTDIRIKSLAAMRAGVAVKAVADGVVLGTRNSIDDISIRAANAPNIKNKECGNGVHLEHADGYRTQYCHMKKGSVTVRTGQQVKAGDVLGEVGLSGGTEFPHLHLSVMHNASKLDPFTGQPITTPCNAALATTAKSMWAEPIDYQPTALLNDGITDTAPDREAMRDAPQSQSSLPISAPALVYWVDILNVQAGDVITSTILAPDGTEYARKTATMEKPLAAYFSFIGKKNSAGNLPPGVYRPSVTVERNGKAVLSVKRAVSIR